MSEHYKSNIQQELDNSDEIKKIKDDAVFWNQNAKGALDKWRALVVPETQIEKYLEIDYDIWKKSDDPSIQKVRDVLNTLVAYIDIHAADGAKLNPSRRVVATANIRQNAWTRQMLLLKKGDNVLETVENAVRYIDQPDSYFPIISEDHKKKIVLELLGQNEYNRDDFEKLLSDYRDSFTIVCKNLLNKNLIFTRALYATYLHAKSPVKAMSISSDVRMKIYKDFLKNCIQSNSVDNYSQFSRIDGWVKTSHPDFKGVISIESETEAKALYDELDSWPEMPDKKKSGEKFKEIGGGQYHNALLMYIRFLHAIEICSQLAEYRAKSGNDTSLTESYNKYLTALRTKPFLLLAGISGTGKSRIVREMAYKSCPDEDDLRADSTTPGNYLMVEVKPNWHDSSELLGYYSNISKKYILTPFVKFLVKAKKYPNVPFFVCLDEMNLAPVEQYFAEFLSVLETRRKTESGIKSGVLVKKEHLTELGETEDLTLPSNVFIIGTVNMDDTTHQFSRKVIDRAMTIEMNGGNLEDMFGHSSNLDYVDDPWTMDNELLMKYANADEVLAAHSHWADKIKSSLPAKLENINKCLKGTPFEVSYRVLNELTIYLGVLLDDTEEVDDAKFDELVEMAVDQILLMKILPRVEGDAEMFNLTEDSKKEIDNKEITNKLEWLKDICPTVTYTNDAMTSKKKLEEMIGRMNSGFTRYWP